MVKKVLCVVAALGAFYTVSCAVRVFQSDWESDPRAEQLASLRELHIEQGSFPSDLAIDPAETTLDDVPSPDSASNSPAALPSDGPPHAQADRLVLEPASVGAQSDTAHAIDHTSPNDHQQAASEWKTPRWGQFFPDSTRVRMASTDGELSLTSPRGFAVSGDDSLNHEFPLDAPEPPSDWNSFDADFELHARWNRFDSQRLDLANTDAKSPFHFAKLRDRLTQQPDMPAAISPVGVDQQGSPKDVLADLGVDATWSRETIDYLIGASQKLPILPRNRRFLISLDDLIARAVLHSKQVGVLKIAPVEERLTVYEEYGEFDWTAFLSAQLQEENQPTQFSDETLNPIAAIKRRNNQLATGLRKRTTTGGQLQMYHQMAGEADNTGFRLNPEQAISELGLSFSQELLRDSGRNIVLSRVLAAEFNADATRGDAVAQINELIQNVVTQYWSLFEARGEYFVQSTLLKSAEEILERLESRSQVDAQENIISQARALVLESKADLRNAQARVLVEQDRLVRLVNDPVLVEDHIEIVTHEGLSPRLVRLDSEQELAIAIKNRGELYARLSDIRIASLQHHVALNQVLPRLTFSIESSLVGLSSRNQVTDAFGNLGDTDPSVTGLLNLEFFIQNRSARAAAKKAKLAFQRLQLEYEDTLASITLDVRSAIRQLNASEEVLDLRRQTLEQRRRELDYLALRREVIPRAGASTSLLLEQFFLAINRLVASQSAYIAAVTQQQRALMELQRARGLIVRMNYIPSDTNVPHIPLYRAKFDQMTNKAMFKDLIDQIPPVPTP